MRCLCTPHKRTVFGEGWGGVQQRLLCLLASPMGVLYGCFLRVLMEWFVCMMRVVLCLANTEAQPSGTRRNAFYKQNRDGHEVQGCGRQRGRGEVLWDARVLCGCEVGFDVLSEHSVGIFICDQFKRETTWGVFRSNIKRQVCITLSHPLMAGNFFGHPAGLKKFKLTKVRDEMKQRFEI